ncbi:MAG: hypothetical protein IJ019_05825 [Alphaproteobacteria bacterium]|nr:hypothetical protein [Alphaproteobacteria bacterium]
MRKYFLLSAAALMMATNVNASSAPEYADVKVSAEVEIAQKIDCTNVDFGTIILKSDRGSEYVMMNPDSGNNSKSSGIFSWSGGENANCGASASGISLLGDEEFIELANTTNSSSLSITFEPQMIDGYIGGTLRFPLDNEEDSEYVLAGTYVGSFTVVQYPEE